MEQKSKPCPHCKTDVDPKATRCPHCHGKIYRWTTGRKVAAGIFGFLIIVLVFGGSSDDKSSTTSTPAVPEGYTNIEVCVEAEMMIKNMLKSPATADFPTCSNFSIERLENDGFKVSSYVDSQNGFGALIRTEWTIKYYYLNGGTHTRTDLVIMDGEVMYDRSTEQQ